jgi:hypothetical protein
LAGVEDPLPTVWISAKDPTAAAALFAVNEARGCASTPLGSVCLLTFTNKTFATHAYLASVEFLDGAGKVVDRADHVIVMSVPPGAKGRDIRLASSAQDVVSVRVTAVSQSL